MQVLIDVVGSVVVVLVLWYVGDHWVARVWDKHVRRVLIFDTYNGVLDYSAETGKVVIANLRDDGRWEVEL